MPQNLATDLVRVAVRWGPAGGSEWLTEEAVMTWHLRLNSTTGIPTHWPEWIANLPTDLEGKFATHWGSLAANHSDQAQINQIKASHLDTTGHVIDEWALDVAPGDLRGSSSAGMLPPEVALCLSWWSYQPGSFASAKGRKRGRMYLPYLSTVLADPSGKVDTAYLNPLVSHWQSFFNDVQGMHTNPDALGAFYWDFVTYSGVDATWHNVDWISADNHFDSQRRRQHQDTPLRHVLPISHA